MILIEKWGGLVTNASPYALPGGACVIQTNIQCLRPGQLQVRNGMTNAITGTTGQVLSAVRHPTGSVERIVCQAGTAIRVESV